MTIATGEQALASDIQAIAGGRAKISSGTYSGNSTQNRAIPHGLGVTPKLVIIRGTNIDYVGFHILGTGLLYYWTAAGQGVSSAVTAPDATNFYVGDNVDYTTSANSSASSRTYEWVAFSSGA